MSFILESMKCFDVEQVALVWSRSRTEEEQEVSPELLHTS